MTASSRRSSSTGDPSGTARTSMPSSAGAGTESSSSRWDPGRRPSSRVSSTSGAFGSRLLTSNSHIWTPTQPRNRIRRPTDGAKRVTGGVSPGGSERARAKRQTASGPALGEPRDELLAHGLGDQAAYVAPERRDLLDEARGDERVADGTGEEDGLDRGEVRVHLRHRQLVLVVTGPAEALDDRHGPDLAAEVDDEPVEARHTHVGDARGGLAQHRDPFVGREQPVLAHVDADGDDDLVEELGGTTDDVEVAVGHRVERPGADSATHGCPSFRLGLGGAPVPSRDQGARVA